MREYAFVNSSNLEKGRYDEEKKTLEITFKNGKATYLYENVGVDKFNALCEAPSAGSYFIKNIKSEHKFTRM